MSSTKQTKHSTPLLTRRTALTKLSGAPLRKEDSVREVRSCRQFREGW